MTITVELPDGFTSHENPGRAALEALAIAGYRSGNLSSQETRLLLGFETRTELDGFLKQHQVWEQSYSLEDYKQDLASIQQHEARQPRR